MISTKRTHEQLKDLGRVIGFQVLDEVSDSILIFLSIARGISRSIQLFPNDSANDGSRHRRLRRALRRTQGFVNQRLIATSGCLG